MHLHQGYLTRCQRRRVGRPGMTHRSPVQICYAIQQVKQMTEKARIDSPRLEGNIEMKYVIEIEAL